MLLRTRADDLLRAWWNPRRSSSRVLTVMLEIRHLMNDGDIYRARPSLTEIALQVSTGLAMPSGSSMCAHARQHRARRRRALRRGALLWRRCCAARAELFNPVFTGEPVGGRVLQALLLGYGVPAILMRPGAGHATARPAGYRMRLRTAMLLALVYLTLEVRRIFHGPVIAGRSHRRRRAIHLFGGVARMRSRCCCAASRWRSQPARLASAAVVLLTVAKVFLYDLAGAHGVFRALSLICLGLMLVGIGWLYQRLLFPPAIPDFQLRRQRLLHERRCTT